MAQICCRDVCLGYDSNILAEQLNMELSAGDYLCVVGENGAGKSTFMRTLLHLQQPLSGEITFGDGLKPTQIGYLPQQDAVQRDFPASVWEIVISGYQSQLGWRPFYSKMQKAGAARNMKRMDILPLARKCYRELSGGQQQRVLLARALCATQKVLLLDEPVTGLDPVASADMYKLVSELNKKDGISIIMISHDVQVAVRYASHILHIGKKVFFGTKDEYLKSEVGKHFLNQEAL